MLQGTSECVMRVQYPSLTLGKPSKAFRGHKFLFCFVLGFFFEDQKVMFLYL